MDKIRFDCAPVFMPINPKLIGRHQFTPITRFERFKWAAISILKWSLVIAVYLGWIALCIIYRYPQGIMPIAVMAGIFLGIKMVMWLTD